MREKRSVKVWGKYIKGYESFDKIMHNNWQFIVVLLRAEFSLHYFFFYWGIIPLGITIQNDIQNNNQLIHYKYTLDVLLKIVLCALIDIKWQLLITILVFSSQLNGMGLIPPLPPQFKKRLLISILRTNMFLQHYSGYQDVSRKGDNSQQLNIH